MRKWCIINGGGGQGNNRTSGRKHKEPGVGTECMVPADLSNDIKRERGRG